MNTEDIRMIRRVQGQRGSVSLYRYRDGLVEVVNVTEEGTDLIELRRHDLGLEPELLAYMAEVQSGIDGLDTRVQAKRKGTEPTRMRPRSRSGGRR
jgi:hypothetical protein